MANSTRSQGAKKAAWESPLRALLDEPEDANGIPLAIELCLTSGSFSGATPRLMARLMRPAARGGWVNGSLAWSSLDAWHIQTGEYRDDHLAILRQLCATQRASESRLSYYHSYRADRALDLTDCSAHLWPILEELDRLGVRLIHAHASNGDVRTDERGEVLVDVTAGKSGGLVVRGRTHVEQDADLELEPVTFLGREGHGLVCVGPPDPQHPKNRPLHLVHLARSANPQLQRLVLDEAAVEVPARDLKRFVDEICPALRGVAKVTSSDGSFTPPEISPPSLVLHVEHGRGHRIDIGWAFDYRVGEKLHRVPLGDNGVGFRDRAAEKALITSHILEAAGLRALGLLDPAGRPTVAPPLTLTGLESLRFTTGLLPDLLQLSDVEVWVSGEPADYRDVGDSLDIGVSTAEIDGERDWFDLGVTIRAEGREVPFSDVFRALANGETQLLLDDGAHFSLLEPRLQSLRQLIEEARTLSDSKSRSLRISRYQAGLWSELSALGIVTEQAQAWQRQVGTLLALDTLPEHPLPKTLTADLRHYQREGFDWLATLWGLELGGILADDMGLGKTLQALALICHARERDPAIGPFLVVAPTSVVSGWKGEAARFAPTLRVSTVADTFAKSGKRIEDTTDADIVITTYTLLRLDAEAYRSVSWAGVLLDEAQSVKNHESKTYRAARKLRAPFKLAITGTPMENNLMELWSLLSITAPGLFPDPKRFTEEYARPIERDRDLERLARLRRRIKPLVMRRTKELVAPELPAKQEQNLEIDLHPRHRKIYDTYLQRERQKVLGLIDDFDRNRFTILRSITLLRQLSLHAGLVDDANEAVPCAKLDALVEQLDDVIGGGHRALVFSQFTGFLAKAREYFDREGISYCYLDGRTRNRERVLERFRSGDDPVFLISLKAGGFGLNLTEADYCFLLDPWWNPATESQAIDRIHRIGQMRHVMVYRILARGTIEEKVVAFAQRKAALFSGVMDDGDLFASGITADDIRGLIE